jgi:hypothetical protein
MHPDFALKAIIQIPIAILIVILLLAFLMALRKELNGEEAGRSAVYFALAVIGLCACVALLTAYIHARKTVQPGYQRSDVSRDQALGAPVFTRNAVNSR